MYQQSSFKENLIHWFDENQREMPWRQTTNPYYIWLSEVMLQQTQVKTVIDYYHRFVERFPTVEVLSQASEDEVLKYWEGLDIIVELEIFIRRLKKFMINMKA